MNHPVKAHYKAQIQKLREDAVMLAVNRLLAHKGYDFMTVDAVAAEAGMAKASLYKIFPSKEALAAAAMVRILDLALAEINRLREDATLTALEKLKSITLWAMQTKLEGQMPSLPAHNSQLSLALQSDEAYMERLFALSTQMGSWVSAAQRLGQINRDWPVEMVLYMIFACACDPVLEMMNARQQYSHAQILTWRLDAHFAGIGLPPSHSLKKETA